MRTPDTIYFYLATDEYGCFSNFSRHAIVLKDKKWPTSEHYFQAQKYAGTALEEKVRLVENPGQAAKIGRDKTLPLRADWEEVKEGIMKEALIAKFMQNPALKAILLSTGQKTLVEHTSRDSYWADGGDGRGKNRLGVLLMEVRDEFRAQEVASSDSGSNTNSNLPLPQPEPEAVAEEDDDDGAGEMSGDTSSDDAGDDDGDDNDASADGDGVGDGLQPNRNHLYQVPASAEKSRQAQGPVKVAHRSRRQGGALKGRHKRDAYRDQDGMSKFERTGPRKEGQVTVIGDGTVFSEKALPPSAKFVVHRHQTQRKYYATEADFPDQPEEYERRPSSTAQHKKKKPLLSDYVIHQVGDGIEDEDNVYEEEYEFEQPPPEALTTTSTSNNNSVHSTTTDNNNSSSNSDNNTSKMSVEECISAAKDNLELLAQVSDNDIRAAIKETCTNLRNTMAKFIQEFAENDNSEQLLKVMEQYELLQAVC